MKHRRGMKPVGTREEVARRKEVILASMPKVIDDIKSGKVKK